MAGMIVIIKKEIKIVSAANLFPLGTLRYVRIPKKVNTIKKERTIIAYAL